MGHEVLDRGRGSSLKSHSEILPQKHERESVRPVPLLESAEKLTVHDDAILGDDVRAAR